MTRRPHPHDDKPMTPQEIRAGSVFICLLIGLPLPDRVHLLEAVFLTARVTLTCAKTGRWWTFATEGMARQAAKSLGITDYEIEVSDA